jgi:hypothetical protein
MDNIKVYLKDIGVNAWTSFMRFKIWTGGGL